MNICCERYFELYRGPSESIGTIDYSLYQL